MAQAVGAMKTIPSTPIQMKSLREDRAYILVKYRKESTLSDYQRELDRRWDNDARSAGGLGGILRFVADVATDPLSSMSYPVLLNALRRRR